MPFTDEAIDDLAIAYGDEQRFADRPASQYALEPASTLAPEDRARAWRAVLAGDLLGIALLAASTLWSVAPAMA